MWRWGAWFVFWDIPNYGGLIVLRESFESFAWLLIMLYGMAQKVIGLRWFIATPMHDQGGQWTWHSPQPSTIPQVPTLLRTDD